MQKVKEIKFLNFPAEYKLRKKEYLKAFNSVMKSGDYILAEEVKNFENNLAKYLGAKYCVGVANGLEAIQIALMAKDIKRGDEVITTPISAVATTLSILAVGATPVFCDVNYNGQIDITKIEKLINNRTKIILPVDLYGQPCNLLEIINICKKHKLICIEDACQAHGSTLRGKKLGTFGDIGVFSFYPTKNLGAIGDGGALVTNNRNLSTTFREIRDYGQKSKYIHSRFGLNSRLDELQAALLEIKLKYLDHDNTIRRKIAAKYVSNLKKIDEITMILPNNINDSNFHLFIIRTNKRDKLQKYLKLNGIPSLIHYPLAIPDQPLFGNKYKQLDLSEARKFVDETLSLPCNPFLKMSEVDYISDKIKHFFNQS